MAAPVPPSAPNLRDLARAAGYSVSTVSLALRGRSRIAASTRAHILKTAREIGYQANPLVSAFLSYVRTGQSSRFRASLAFVSASAERLETNRVRRTLAGARERARQLGYGLEAFSLDAERDRPGVAARKLGGILRARGIPGVILDHLPPPLLAEGFSWDRHAWVATYDALPLPLTAVTADFTENTALLLDRVAARGHLRIGVLTPPGTEGVARDLEIPYSERCVVGACLAFATRRSRPVLPPAYVTGRRELAAWLRKHRPDAIISLFNGLLGAVPAALPAGCPMPARYTLNRVEPDHPLEGIDQRHEQISAVAVDVLVAQINRNERGLRPVPRTVTLKGLWSGKTDSAPVPPSETTTLLPAPSPA